MNSPAASLLSALGFAAVRHRLQRRKGAEGQPFINHAIEVADLLARAGVTDLITLQAAVLHDTLEDTATLPEEIEDEFGAPVRQVVEEVSDDQTLLPEERRYLQIVNAPHLSDRAKLIRIADKIVNVRSITRDPPVDWSLERRRDYLRWSARVIAGCRGCSGYLDSLYDAAVREASEIAG